ncbi:hypothetical protein PSTG_09733 [Puccinia striiformis f. sp. tritici PST-78]|uniref:Uncharacterized protein n=1 Tax=Puccinia striiformis f. sp. tritici PST-78 TaxID=1165861 RepID=A0A0L0VCL1_9BASI|nr:hypothetical protein PSTG_09733 [Puccinia striiformis f. sp. tritici PST-78]
MPKDNNEPDHGPRTSEADAYSAYCSLDGFIQPPPPHVATAYQAIEPMPASPPPMPAATPCQATQVADNPLTQSMLASAQLLQADLQLGHRLFNKAPKEIQWKLSSGDQGPSLTEDTRNSLQKLIRVVQPPPIVTRGTAHPFTASTDQSICIGTTTGLQEATLTPRSSNKSRLDVQPGHLPSCHGQALQLASDQRATRVLSPGVGTPAAKIREEINANAGILMQMTMLQLVTIHHLVHRAPGNTRSQFDLIDDHLEAVRQKLHAELQVHTLLVLRQDQQLFPGDVMFTDVPTELVCLPSALNNDIELQQIHLELGSKPSNAAVDAYFEREVASLAL